MAQPNILASCWTTAGNALPTPGRELSPIPLPARIEAAAEAGFGGVGLLHLDLEQYLRTNGVETLRALLLEHGVESVELEFLPHWWEPAGERRARSDRILELLLPVAAELAPHHVKIGPDPSGGSDDTDGWAGELHRVAAAFAEVGTPVALEFMPFSNIPTLAATVDLVRAAGHPNSGVMLDLWHLERGGVGLEEIAELDVSLIKGVELNDGDRRQVGDWYEDAVSRRRLPGEGSFRVVEFVSVLKGLGWEGPWGVEILSDEHRSRRLGESLPATFAATAACLDRADARLAEQLQGPSR